MSVDEKHEISVIYAVPPECETETDGAFAGHEFCIRFVNRL